MTNENGMIEIVLQERKAIELPFTEDTWWNLCGFLQTCSPEFFEAFSNEMGRRGVSRMDLLRNEEFREAFNKNLDYDSYLKTKGENA